MIDACQGIIMTNTQKNFLEVFQKNAANISVSCAKVNIARATFYNWINDNDEFAKAVEDIKESLIDFAESNLFKLIKGVEITETDETTTDRVLNTTGSDGLNKIVTLKTKKKKTITGKPDTAAIIFFLKTKAKQRGYIEKQIVENTNYNMELSEQDLDKFDNLTTDEKMKLVELNKKIYE